MPRKSVFTRIRQDWDLYIMLLIPLLFLFIFKYIPMGGLIMAFQEFDIFEGFTQSPWVGFDNFRDLFITKEFINVVLNTLIISWYKILFFFPMPIIMAILLNEIGNMTFKRVIQTIVFMPHFLSWVVVAGLLFDLFSNTGTVNQMISRIGGTRVQFLMDAGLFRSFIIGSVIWKEIGYSAIVYLATITTIDPTLYEAAMVDGAGKMRQVLHITLPGLIPIIVVMLLLRIGTIMDANVEQIISLYNPTVYKTGDVIGTYIFRTGLGNMQYSFAAAAGLFNSSVSFTLVVICNALSRHFVRRSLW